MRGGWGRATARDAVMRAKPPRTPWQGRGGAPPARPCRRTASQSPPHLSRRRVGGTPARMHHARPHTERTGVDGGAAGGGRGERGGLCRPPARWRVVGTRLTVCDVLTHTRRAGPHLLPDQEELRRPRHVRRGARGRGMHVPMGRAGGRVARAGVGGCGLAARSGCTPGVLAGAVPSGAAAMRQTARVCSV